MRSRILGTLTLLVILALSGCASWLDAGPQDPVVSLVRVELVKAGLLQQKFKLHFRLDNPNDNTLTVRALHYRIYLDQWLLAEGESDQWLTVEPNSRMVFCGAGTDQPLATREAAGQTPGKTRSTDSLSSGGHPGNRIIHRL